MECRLGSRGAGKVLGVSVSERARPWAVEPILVVVEEEEEEEVVEVVEAQVAVPLEGRWGASEWRARAKKDMAGLAVSPRRCR